MGNFPWGKWIPVLGILAVWFSFTLLIGVVLFW